MKYFFQNFRIFILVITFIFVALLSACNKSKFRGTEFIIGNGAEPESIDPQLITGTVENRVVQTMFEALFIYDPKTAEPINGLIESYSVDDDGIVYQFTLRDGLVWSDGNAITTDDVVFSLRRILAPELASPYAWFPALFLKNGDAYNKGQVSADELGVRAIDERVFELTLVGPLPYVLDALTHYAFTIVPKHIIEQYGENWTLPENIVSSGPFMLKEWLPQDRLVVDKNPLYWDAENVALDRVVFLPGDDLNTNYNAYVNGEVDWIVEVPQGRLDEAKLRDDYYVGPIFATYYYSLQFKKPELADVRVREALARSINKKDMVENVLRSGQVPTDAYVPPLPDYVPVEGFSYNIERAQELLSEAGYPNGEGFPKLTVLYNTNDNHKRVAEYIQQEWFENLGINIELENMEWKTFLQKRRSGDFDIARNGWVGDYLDPNTFLDLYIGGGGSNEIQYANSQYNELLLKAAKTRGISQRMSLLREAESLLVEKDAVIIPLYYYISRHMFNNAKWQGFHSNIADEHNVKFIKPQ